VRIIAGSGAGGCSLVAQKESGIKSMADLAAAKGKGLKIGTVRFNTFELTLYRALVKAGLAYSDYKIVWFNDTLALAPRSKPSARSRHACRAVRDRLIDQLGGAPIASSLDAGAAWSRLRDQHHRAYPREQAGASSAISRRILRADAAIKADMPKAVEVLDAAKFYRVNKESLTAALPRQMPQVDITKGGDKGMEIAVADMVALGYLKSPPKIIDTTLLKEVLG
jgi:NitT/TauT family transport system substrate-binding protein